MMKTSSPSLGWLAGVCMFCCVGSAALAEDWPQWRGPRGDGTSLEQNVPTHWSATQNVRWKTPIPGKGHSSPVVWQDRIFVTTCLEDEQTAAAHLRQPHVGEGGLAARGAQVAVGKEASSQQLCQRHAGNGRNARLGGVLPGAGDRAGLFRYEWQRGLAKIPRRVSLHSWLLQLADPLQGHGDSQLRSGCPGVHHRLRPPTGGEDGEQTGQTGLGHTAPPSSATLRARSS